MTEFKTSVPLYYQSFSCIADRCEHNCCIGWDIEIDSDTLDYYGTLKGKTADRIMQNISPDGCFVMSPEGRCPLLGKAGLCDIIKEYGEGALCSICADHPRFRNFYTDFCEMGLGMCCEEAARIILGFKEPFSIKPTENAKVTAEERAFFKVRQNVFSMLQDRQKSMLSRMETVAEEFGFEFSDFCLNELCSLYSSLERLDNVWTEQLKMLLDFEFSSDFFTREDIQLPFEQLACYFIFRHFGREEGNYYSPVCFALAGCYMIGALCSAQLQAHGTLTLCDISEYARMYSAEIEYSEENTDILFNYWN